MNTQKTVIGFIAGFITLATLTVMSTSKRSAGFKNKILSNGKIYAGELKDKFNKIQQQVAEKITK